MPGARPFTHVESGTDESTWLLDPRWDAVARLDVGALLDRYPQVIVVAPHPDDESLALGSTLADLADHAAAVTIVFVTHGGDGLESTARRNEAEHALAVLGGHIAPVWWDLPDGHLRDVVGDITRRLSRLIDDQTVLLAPVECDGHGDHEAVAVAAHSAARERGAALLLYPVWLWHWAKPDDLDWARPRTLAPSLRALQAKSSALECYTSQLNAANGLPIIGAAVLNRARRVFETVLLPIPSDLAARVDRYIAQHRSRDIIAAPFDSMLTCGVTDPWHLDDSEYEKRRLALTLACLGRRGYQHALEIGCATGQLSELLRQRARHVVGMDASENALAVARTRTDTVDWLLGAAPIDIPEADFDLIVLSEVAYFLDGPELLATLRAAHRHLLPGGEILIASWSAPTEHIPLDGPTVLDQAGALLDLPRRARYHDADLTIEVWGEPLSVYRECVGTA